MESPIRIIIEELDKTRQLVAGFQDAGKPSNIEKDIALSKLRNIYELIQQLKTGEAFAPDIVESVPKPKETKVQPQQETARVFEAEQPRAAQREEVKAPEAKPVEAERPHQEMKPAQHVKTEILAEKFQPQSFLNEALAQYRNMKDLSHKMQSQPLQDISSAINLNDRFLFIKELFGNDGALYQITIDKLNNASDFNEAIRYLDGNFSWDFNSAQVQKLLELVRRRYLHAE